MGNGVTRKKCLFAMALLLSLTVLTSAIELAEANPLPAPPILKIYIRSDGAVDPPTVPIQRSGNVYTFTNDITNATIQIQRNNTILDGANHTLKGNTFWDTAINLTNTNSILIKNLIITNYGGSIQLTNSSNITILNNTMHTSWNILLESSNDNQIISNNITGQDKGFGYGIQFKNSYNNLIATNNFNDIGSAITIALSKSNTFYHNNFLNNKNNAVGYIEENNYEKWSDNNEGNYWSNYEGIDANNDGIGDTPYIIDEKRQDPYPLMTPSNITNINIDIHTPTIENDQNQTIIITAGTLAVAITVGACLTIYFKKHRH